MVRQEAIARLQQQADQLDVIFQAVDDGITVQDREGHLVYANTAGARLIGYDSPEELLAASRSEILGRFKIFTEDGRQIAPEDLPGRLVFLGHRPPEHILGFRILATGEEFWSTVRSAPIYDENGQIALAVSVFADVTERKRVADERERLLQAEREARLRAEDLQRFFSFLAEAGRELVSSLDYEETLARVATLAVPHIADWCGIHVVQEDGTVAQLAVAHVDPAKVSLARELERRYPFDPEGPTGAPNVIRTGKSELIEEVPDELLVELIEDPELLQIMRDLGLRSSMVVPLKARDQVLGAITLVSAESGHHFGLHDLALAEELAARAALAVDNARLYRRSAQAAAEQAAILEHMADGVVMVDPSGNIAYLNKVGLEMFGDPGQNRLPALISASHMRDRRDEPMGPEQSALTRALGGETVLNAERYVDRPDGSELVLRVSATPITGVGGQVIGAVAVFHDITDEHVLDREKEAFLAAAAHDLKTPLSTIKGVAQVMQRRLSRVDSPDADRLVRSMGQIDDAVNRMNRLVNDLLDTSRLQMGRPLDLNLAPVDLVSLLKRIARESRHASSRHQVTIQCELPELVGEWDQDRLDRVFSNLISNAIKYSPDGGEVVVSIETENDDHGRVAVVRVRDRGLGIPEEDQARIFERFFRAGNVQARIQGTGIGLSSARSITEQHGGEISARSKEGEGATFEVRLPLS